MSRLTFCCSSSVTANAFRAMLNSLNCSHTRCSLIPTMGPLGTPGLPMIPSMIRSGSLGYSLLPFTFSRPMLLHNFDNLLFQLWVRIRVTIVVRQHHNARTDALGRNIRMRIGVHFRFCAVGPIALWLLPRWRVRLPPSCFRLQPKGLGAHTAGLCRFEQVPGDGRICFRNAAVELVPKVSA